MSKRSPIELSIRFPWLVILLAAAMSALFAVQFPQVQFDNDPENMLAPDEPVRVFHHKVKKQYDLYDFVIVGIVNETDPDGIFNTQTLHRIDRLTGQLLSLHQTETGKPAIRDPETGTEQVLDLQPESGWQRMLNTAFRHNPEELFDEEGHSAIVDREVISPSVVDNIKQEAQGQLRIEYLMETPPQSREEAQIIRQDAMSNPLYKGTLVAEDGQAIALYIPIIEKSFSHNVASLVRELTAGWSEEDRVYITGLPVAEDTFGIEMLVQMATSAPLAGLAIFIILFLFFRQLSLIIAPMIIAVISVICTMGLLIGLGYNVHIMSSMIAIFLMPIAVADSVHILSEFYDTYPKIKDKAETIRQVIKHLFRPMLYTSLTTMAGFASLGLTPIPPVKVFGLHVAFGVGLAWALTMTLIPAYIMLAVSSKSLERLPAAPQKQTGGQQQHASWLDPFLAALGSFSSRRWKLVLLLCLVSMAISAVGISRINVNDNPVKWFVKEHRIREADRILNKHFGGTYTAYLTFKAADEANSDFDQWLWDIQRTASNRLTNLIPKDMERLQQQLAAVDPAGIEEPARFFEALRENTDDLNRELADAWNQAADAVLYTDPATLNKPTVRQALENAGVPSAMITTLMQELEQVPAAGDGEALQQQALDIADTYLSRTPHALLYDLETIYTAPLFKRPDMLRYIEDLQAHLQQHPVVGKSSSCVDALKKANYELNRKPAPENAGSGQTKISRQANHEDYSVPDSPAAVGQVFTQLEGMKKKDALFHLVTREYDEINVWIQLKSGDNKDMETVVQEVETYLNRHRPPQSLETGWAGLTYLNVVWQDKMVRGMLSALGSSFIVVLIMMIVLFRSPLYGLLSMVPLTLTITLIYGIIGLVGKDYDMPVAVLSSLTLGLSIDFAIHFLQRAREESKKQSSWHETVAVMFREPAKAISRNAIIISIGFTPLLAAPLVPYKTVGFFLATIMAVSWMATLVVLTSLLSARDKRTHKLQEEK